MALSAPLRTRGLSMRPLHTRGIGADALIDRLSNVPPLDERGLGGGSPVINRSLDFCRCHQRSRHALLQIYDLRTSRVRLDTSNA
ncbi:hypothetical protein PsYK624_155360 [Phanerochaete sordida]|uniref:Uncharacterized protein n=1 Tax=Phanerochaete sordida TaxID=48140 RepID=A0A9P3LL37_9APHY|nr:hypothetical protein PsYK624_155360 [Phanerochaete sordida]